MKRAKHDPISSVAAFVLLAVSGCLPPGSASLPDDPCNAYEQERCVLDVTGESGTLTYAPAACETLAITGEPAGALTVTFEGSMSCFVRLENLVSDDPVAVVWPEDGFVLNPVVVEDSSFSELRVESSAPQLHLRDSVSISSKVIAVGFSMQLDLPAGNYTVETYLPDGTRGSTGGVYIALGGPSPFDLDMTRFTAHLHLPAEEVPNMYDLTHLPALGLYVTYEAEAPDGIVERVRDVRDALRERDGRDHSSSSPRFSFLDGTVYCDRGPCEWIPKPEAPDAGPALDAGPTVFVDGGHD